MSTQVHHAEPGFFKKYFWSTDHKMIAMQYLFTGMAMGVIGGFLAYVFRMQLGFPNQHVPGIGRPHVGQISSVNSSSSSTRSASSAFTNCAANGSQNSLSTATQSTCASSTRSSLASISDVNVSLTINYTTYKPHVRT